MATVQAYTKAGVDAKLNARSNMTMVHSGGGTPDIAAFPDAKTGDVIERSGDGARWSVIARNLTPIEGRVVSVAGKSGVVTLTASDVGAARASHNHTKAQITDLNPSTTATANSMAQRDSGGRLVVGVPTMNTHATTKGYVDDKISTSATEISAQNTWANTSGKPSTFPPSSHTHPVSQITGLDLVHNATTAFSVVQRDGSGRITVATPTVTGHATTKAYVDNAVTAAKAWSAITGKPSTFTPSSHTHTMAQITDLPEVTSSVTNNAIVRRWSSGQIMVPTTPAGSQSATSKEYVDTKFESGYLTTQNLNYLITPANYFQGRTDYATTARNYPPGARAGHLVVIQGSIYVKQEYTDYLAEAMYYRTKYADTWYPWQSIAQSEA